MSEKILYLILAIIFFGLVGYILVSKDVLSPISDHNLTPVTVRLKWLHQTQFAGHYVADQKGFYADEGISVDLKPFDYENFPIDDVVSGNADFGVAGADEILIARSKGKPVVALAVIYQRNPAVAYSLKESNILKPTDIVGKKLGVQSGVNTKTIVLAMLEDQGININDINLVDIGFSIDPIINKEVDVATGYLTNEPIQVRELGKEVNIIDPSKYGIKVYADVLFTTEENIKKNPNLVKGFVRATLKGWTYTLGNIDEAVNLTLKYKDPNNPALNFEHQKALLNASTPLIKPSNGTKIGEMSYLNWRTVYELMLKYKLINQTNVNDAYTTMALQ